MRPWTSAKYCTDLGTHVHARTNAVNSCVQSPFGEWGSSVLRNPSRDDLFEGFQTQISSASRLKSLLRESVLVYNLQEPTFYQLIVCCGGIFKWSDFMLFIPSRFHVCVIRHSTDDERHEYAIRPSSVRTVPSSELDFRVSSDRLKPRAKKLELAVFRCSCCLTSCWMLKCPTKLRRWDDEFCA